MNTKLEICIDVISSVAAAHWADNWNFRAFLQQEVSPTVIDRTALEVCLDVSSKIDCTACGNCCREIHPHFKGDDVSRLASGLGVSEGELRKSMREEVGETSVFCASPCPMLKENKCTVYQHRPDDCREYPHLHKPDFLGGSIGAIENYGTCPIVFNVYGQLKSRFHYDATRDYIGDSDPETTHGSTFKGPVQ
jgi:Fe-S-cluster containining protein